ncbi:MAG: hypothetical protein ACO1O1_03875 [Adhaeribacter sp.]
MIATIQPQAFAQKPAAASFIWKQLPAIPDPVGFAGSFAGVSGKALIVAGGANFPDGGAPWTGSTKVWYDKIFALESPQGSWKEVGRLPRPLGYGVSVSWGKNLILLGGSNASGHFADAFMLRYKNGKAKTVALPSLPETNANACGVLVGDIIYLAGGLKKPDAKTTENSFWALDLSKKPRDRKWEVLPAWPGPSRMLSVAGAHQGAFYLFSGTRLVEGQREYLQDAYRYLPGQGWAAIASLPQPCVAAPSPAYTSGQGQLLVFGGDDGKHAAVASELKEAHPGFSRQIWQYDPGTNTWSPAGQVLTHRQEDAARNPNGSLWAPVTTPLVEWQGQVVLPGGEVRPATRTPRVLLALPDSLPRRQD